MAFDINYFLKINNAYGTTNQKDTQLYNLKSQINDRFTDTIDCYKVKVNDVDKELLIIRTIKQDEKTIKSRPDEDFEIGDYVVFDNKTWLVISKDECNQTYTTGTMKLTNYVIKFQSPDGTILSYPCIDSTNTSVGLDENQTMTTGNGMHTIKVPFDENTLLIDTDDRFFIDDLSVKTPQVFAVSKPNRVEFKYGDKGLIELTLKQSAYNKQTDRKDLGVCDYKEHNTEPEQPEGYSYSEITCSNPNNEITLGSSVYRTLTPVWYEADGTLSTDTIAAVWTWNYNGIAQSNFNITYAGNQAKIKVVENYSIIGENITANVMGSNGGYGGSITLTIVA